MFRGQRRFQFSIFFFSDQINFTIHESRNLIVKGLERLPKSTTWVALSTEWIVPERPSLPDPGK